MRAFFVAMTAALILVVSAPALAGAAGPEDDGLRFESSVSYRLDPDARAVLVTMDLTLTNQIPDRGNQYFYFDQTWLPVQSEATNFRATSGGRSLPTRIESTDNPLWSDLRITLGRDLLYGQTQEIRVSYELPDLPPRSEGWTRANPAFASFAAFPVGDPGLADIEVIVPAGYEVEATGSEMTREVVDGETVFRAADVDDPDRWLAALVARNDTLLEESRVTVDDHEVVLRAWPGDAEWAATVGDYVSRGIPVLEELIGQEWPVGGELEIIETSTPHLYGYGGWYNTSTNTIEIGDGLDPQLILHELSHAWLNETVSSEVWLVEGLAEEYSAQAVEALGLDASSAEPVSDTDPGAQPLLAWDQEDPASSGADEQEDYGYRASWWVVDQLAAEIGTDGMAEVIGAAVDDKIAYQGDGEPETVPGATDWQRSLDLFEELGGAESAVGLFTSYVVTDAELSLLAERDAARQVYADLVAAGSGWTAPLEVREAMSDWNFAEVAPLSEAASQVLTTRDAVLEDLDDINVSELPGLEAAYEGAEDLDALAAEAQRYEQVGSIVSAAEESQEGVIGAFAWIGLVGADVDGELDDVAAALTAGDIASAEELSADVESQVDSAGLVGVSRYIVAIEVLFGVFLILQLRRRRVGSGAWSIP